MEDTPQITHAQPISPNHTAQEMPPPAVGLVHAPVKKSPKKAKAKTKPKAAPKAKAPAKPKAEAKAKTKPKGKSKK